MVHVFAVAEAVKEYLIDNNHPEKTMHDEMLERRQADEPDDEDGEEVQFHCVDVLTHFQHKTHKQTNNQQPTTNNQQPTNTNNMLTVW